MAGNYTWLVILFMSGLCYQYHQHIGLEWSSSLHFQCKPTTNGIQYLHRSKFLGARIPYTRNTSASFQLDILVFGDIDPNPGPDHTKHDDHIKPKLVYNSEQLLSFNSYNGTRQSLPKLSTDVWRTITSLDIKLTGHFVQSHVVKEVPDVSLG